MTARIYIDPTRVTVSKSGVNAESPPSVDYFYLALDSRLPQYRPLEIGLVPSYTFGNVVFLSTTYSFAPAIDIFVYTIGGGSIGYNRRTVMRDDDSSTAYQRTCFQIDHKTDRFQPVQQQVFDSCSLFGQVLNMFYVAWNCRS